MDACHEHMSVLAHLQLLRNLFSEQTSKVNKLANFLKKTDAQCTTSLIAFLLIFGVWLWIVLFKLEVLARNEQKNKISKVLCVLCLRCAKLMWMLISICNLAWFGPQVGAGLILYMCNYRAGNVFKASEGSRAQTICT